MAAKENFRPIKTGNLLKTNEKLTLITRARPYTKDPGGSLKNARIMVPCNSVLNIKFQNI